jgi:translation elongation factor EF-Tu-like GTPase
MTFFSKVEDVFQISGRGCVVVPAIPRSSLDFQLHTRDSIQLRNPDGRILDTYIAGIEILCGPRVIDRMAFLLPGNIRKEDVSKETEIWLANRL